VGKVGGDEGGMTAIARESYDARVGRYPLIQKRMPPKPLNVKDNPKQFLDSGAQIVVVPA
jgi:hypothetical protein